MEKCEHQTDRKVAQRIKFAHREKNVEVSN